jgi:hypothetical protein
MALVTAVTAVLMMLAISGTAVLNTMTETTIAAHHRDAIQTLYAAEAGIELSISGLRLAADWTTAAPVTSGTLLVQGALTDLLQVTTVDPRFNVIASVFPDPMGDPDVVIVQAVASGVGGFRRTVQVTLQRAPAAESATMRTIETLSWRER